MKNSSRIFWVKGCFNIYKHLYALRMMHVSVVAWFFMFLKIEGYIGLPFEIEHFVYHPVLIDLVCGQTKLFPFKRSPEVKIRKTSSADQSCKIFFLIIL